MKNDAATTAAPYDDMAAVLKLIEEIGFAPQARLIRENAGMTAERIEAAVEQLVLEGRVKIWPTKTAAIYTYPAAKDPRIADPKNQNNPGDWARGPKKDQEGNEPQESQEAKVKPNPRVPWSRHERILSIVRRRRIVKRTELSANLKISAAEIIPILAELEQEGKIRQWKKPTGGVIVTMPDVTAPISSAPSTESGKPTEVTSKPNSVNRKPARGAAPQAETSGFSSPKEAKPEPVLPSTTHAAAFAAALAILEAKRDAIDEAIRALKAVA